MESWRKEFYASDYGSEYLMHHGIKGQKWGRRRYQNEDGTLTEVGKARYAENYSDQQRTRDKKIYGNSAVRRINKRMLNGESIQSARHNEAVYKEKKEKAKTTTRRIMKPLRDLTIAATGAAVLALGATAITKAVNGEKIVLKDLPRDTINMGRNIVNNMFGGIASSASSMSSGFTQIRRPDGATLRFSESINPRITTDWVRSFR